MERRKLKENKEARMLCNNALVYGRENSRRRFRRSTDNKTRQVIQLSFPFKTPSSFLSLSLPFSLYLSAVVSISFVISSSNTSRQSAIAQLTISPLGNNRGCAIDWIFFSFRLWWPWLSTFTHESIRKRADLCLCIVWVMRGLCDDIIRDIPVNGLSCC